eukprot:TRINITY_DN2553_c0_g1_i1.p1 TRINITY_DN2553_c0_g1~~TRINITY_DN2553_c0_g1_i1.p1  ORF type:complete len:529 (+),score=222.24 TRINITY_DN2553_c0_g1_i1:125-1711(+)
MSSFAYKRWLMAGVLIALLIATPSLAQGDEDEDEDDEDEDEDEEEVPAGEAGEENVLVLTSSNFDSTINDNEFVLVEFYAPWCGHCKSLAPEYAAAATALKDYEPKIILGKVDATAEAELAEKFEVSGYPTLKFFRNGKASEFGGGRTADDIVEWLKKKTGPAFVTVNTVDEAQKFVDTSLDKKLEVAVIGFFPEGADKDVYEQVAKDTDDVPFAYTSNADVAAHFNAKLPGIATIKKFDEKRNDFNGPFTAEEVSAFIAGSTVPNVLEFNEENSPRIFGGKIDSTLLFFVDQEKEDHQASLDKFGETAKAYKGKIICAWVGKDASHILEYFGITEGDLPVLFMLKLDQEEGGMKKYKHPSLEGLNGFVDSYLAGTASAFYKSEEIPESNDEPVKVVVGKNWNDIVMDETKDVLVEFYAPWCGHCKQLDPKYKKLGKKYKDVESIVIAKIDGTANEIEGVEVGGFPTIKFYPAKDKQNPKDYEGARSVKGMSKFLKAEATVPFTLDGKNYPKQKKAGKDAEAEAKQDL